MGKSLLNQQNKKYHFLIPSFLKINCLKRTKTRYASKQSKWLLFDLAFYITWYFSGVILE
jgi:hypothetical protein